MRYLPLSLFFSLFLFFFRLFYYRLSDECATKSVANRAIGGIPGCKDNSYNSSGDIFYMDAIIDVKGIRFSILTTVPASLPRMSFLILSLYVSLDRFPLSYRGKQSGERHNHRFVYSRKLSFVFLAVRKFDSHFRYVITRKIVSDVQW